MDGEGLLLAGGGSMNIGNPITANRVGVWIKKGFSLCDIRFGSNFVLKHPFDLRKIRIYRVIEKKVKYFCIEAS